MASPRSWCAREFSRILDISLSARVLKKNSNGHCTCTEATGAVWVAPASLSCIVAFLARHEYEVKQDIKHMADRVSKWSPLQKYILLP